jgi:hypothetical protein
MVLESLTVSQRKIRLFPILDKLKAKWKWFLLLRLSEWRGRSAEF